ncbi:MAG: hypothetical protein HFH47_02350 [Bacilli bacterium]|nr:hypothetical protein [Bacilli bacterium]
MKKKCIIICLLTIMLTGCTIVRIDTTSIDNILDVILSKDNTLYNRVGNGYKYYVPRGVTYIDSNGTNDRLYSDGVYYYLYLDQVSYYYNNSVKFKKDNSKYYSRKLNNGDNIGYVEITEKANNQYWIEFVYNYAKIEALVPKNKIEDTVLDASYILSTIKYNDNIIKLSLDDDFLKTKEDKYDEFSSKKEENNNFLRYDDNEDNKD